MKVSTRTLAMLDKHAASLGDRRPARADALRVWKQLTPTQRKAFHGIDDLWFALDHAVLRATAKAASDPKLRRHLKRVSLTHTTKEKPK